MLTTSHGIIAYLLYQKAGRRTIKFAMIGGVLPDLPMLLGMVFMFFVQIFAGDATYDLIHRQMHSIGFIDGMSLVVHSVFFWAIFLTVALISKKKILMAFSIGGVAHVIADFLTHQGRWTWNHLYPLNVAPIEGPFDYTDWRFLAVAHTIWLLVFGPRIFAYFRKRTAGAGGDAIAASELDAS